MGAQEPHGPPGGGAHGGDAEPLQQRFQNRLGRLAGMDDASGNPKRPGGSRNEQSVRLEVVCRPVAARKLVLDQPIGRDGIGHPQERLGEHHKREPLLGGQRVGMEEILNAAEPAGPCANALNEARCIGIDFEFGCGRTSRAIEELRRHGLIGQRIRRVKFAQRLVINRRDVRTRSHGRLELLGRRSMLICAVASSAANRNPALLFALRHVLCCRYQPQHR